MGNNRLWMKAVRTERPIRVDEDGGLTTPKREKVTSKTDKWQEMLTK